MDGQTLYYGIFLSTPSVKGATRLFLGAFSRDEPISKIFDAALIS